MKIIIVGAGPAGLATYLSLHKHLPTADVRVYERHAPLPNVDHMSHGHDSHQNETQGPATATYGGGLGVAPNGMRALHSICPKLYSQVVRDGWEVLEFEFRTGAGWKLGSMPAWSGAPVLDGEGGHEEKCGVGKGAEGKVGTVMIAREALWRVLYAAVRREERARMVKVVHEGVAVVGVDAAAGVVEFADGSRESADLVIGADGVNSIVRKAVLDATEPGRDAQYEGLMSIGGFMPTVPKNCAEAKHNCAASARTLCGKNPSAVFLFGQRGFFGYAPCTMCLSNASRVPGPTSFWWATYASPSYAERTTPASLAEGTAQIQARMGGYTEARVARVLADLATSPAPSRTTSTDSEETEPKPLSRRRTSIKWRDDPSVPPHAVATLTTPTWILPPPPRWHRGRVLLVGDAAHGLPSTSGQGISMAFEDAVALGVLLGRTSSAGATSEAPVEKVLRAFTALRKPRVEKILAAALRMQGAKRDIGYLQLLLTYGFLWVLLRVLPRGADEWRLGYDIEREARDVAIE